MYRIFRANWYFLSVHNNRDTAGQERFRTLTTAYYRGAMGILLMYDVTSLESYNNLSYWLRNIQEVNDFNVLKSLHAKRKPLRNS